MSTVCFRVSLFRNGEPNTPGVVVVVRDISDWVGFLRTAYAKLYPGTPSLPLDSMRVFAETGGELCDLSEVFHDDVLFFESQGADFSDTNATRSRARSRAVLPVLIATAASSTSASISVSSSSSPSMSSSSSSSSSGKDLEEEEEAEDALSDLLDAALDSNAADSGVRNQEAELGNADEEDGDDALADLLSVALECEGPPQPTARHQDPKPTRPAPSSPNQADSVAAPNEPLHPLLPSTSSSLSPRSSSAVLNACSVSPHLSRTAPPRPARAAAAPPATTRTLPSTPAPSPTVAEVRQPIRAGMVAPSRGRGRGRGRGRPLMKTLAEHKADPKRVTRSPPPGLLAQALRTTQHGATQQQQPSGAAAPVDPAAAPAAADAEGHPRPGAPMKAGRTDLLSAQRGWRNSLCMNTVPIQFAPARSQPRSIVLTHAAQSCTSLGSRVPPPGSTSSSSSSSSKLRQLLQAKGNSSSETSLSSLCRSTPDDDSMSVAWNSSWSHKTWKRSKSRERTIKLQLGSPRRAMALERDRTANMSRSPPPNYSAMTLSRSPPAAYPPGLSNRRMLRRSVSANSIPSMLASLSPPPSPHASGSRARVVDPSDESNSEGNRSPPSGSPPGLVLPSVRRPCILHFGVLSKEGEFRTLEIDVSRENLSLYRSQSKRACIPQIAPISFAAIHRYQITNQTTRDSLSKSRGRGAISMPLLTIYGVQVANPRGSSASSPLLSFHPTDQMYQLCEVLNLVCNTSGTPEDLFRQYTPLLCLLRGEVPVKGVGTLFFHIAEQKLYIFQKRGDRVPWAIVDMRVVSLERESPTSFYIHHEFLPKLRLLFREESKATTWYKALRKSSQLTKVEVQRVLDTYSTIRGMFGLRFKVLDTSHVDLLRPIWHAISDDPFPENLTSDTWKQAGFQRDTPLTDLRRVGILGVHTLQYMVTTYPNSFRELCRAAAPVPAGASLGGYYPLAAVAINLTDVLVTRLGLFGEGATDEYLPIFQCFPLFLKTGDVFSELFSYSLVLFHQLWSEMKATYMEFPKVLAIWKDRLDEILTRPPLRGSIRFLFDMIPPLS